MSNIELLEKTLPAAPLKLIAMESCRELGQKVNDYIVSFRENTINEVSESSLYVNYKSNNYLVDCCCPRFGTGEAKGLLKETIRGTDLFIMTDVCNHNLTYTVNGHLNHMSPDDHFQDLKRIISAATGKAKRINVIMPFLYESRQHKRTKRESLDCALALEELNAMGVSNIVTFDAHDPRVQNAIPLSGFDSFNPPYQFMKALFRAVPDLIPDKDHLMIISPDEGAMHRAVYFSNILGVDMGMFYKRRDYSTIINGKNPIVAHEFLGDDVAGKDVVQLYVQTPYIEGGLEKASIQLLDFGKTEVLEPGESQTLEIEFAPEYMASYDEKAVKEDGTEGAWVLDSGDYYFTIGNGAHEALNNVLAVKTDSTDDLITITDDETIEPENVVTVSLGEDKETYSENVENAFQDCDINNLIPDTAEYTTRSDWSKGWKEVESITPIEEMMKGLTNSTYELTENNDEEVVWGADNGLSTVDFLQFNEDGTFAGALPLSDEKWDQLMDQLTLEEAANFIEKAGDKNFEKLDSIFLPEAIWYDGPIGYSYDQIAGYATRWNESNSSEPTYVSSDNEYASYSMSSMPTEPVVAATFNKELVEREGELFGEDGLWSNANSIAAPGLNIHRAPYCSRNHEYYSEDAMLTNLLGTALCKGGGTGCLQRRKIQRSYDDAETLYHESSGVKPFRCFHIFHRAGCKGK